MNFYLPSNLDLEGIVKKNPPDFKFNNTQCKYLLNLIYSIPIQNKSIELVRNYTPIYSKLLKNKIPNYALYYQYLENNGVIEINNSYNLGRSKGYRYTEVYQGEIKAERIHCKKVKKYIQKDCKYCRKTEVRYYHLMRWLSEGLVIDLEKARGYNQKLLNLKLQGILPKDKNKRGFNKDPMLQYNTAEILFLKIQQNDFLPSVDNTSYRLHSPLTQIKSEFRNFITYKGKRLISLDLKNSQPYISTVLFNPLFWTPNSTFNIFKINSNKVIEYYKYIVCTTLSHMWENFANTQYQHGFERFSRIVENGFYEYMKELLSSRLGEAYNAKEKVKETMFLVLFSKNGFFYTNEAAPKRVFAEEFPEVYEFFKCLKSKDYTMLALLLQNIESYIFLNLITKKISKERADLPLFTVHDSIVTVEGEESYVKRVMEEELEALIGKRPTITIDLWTPEKLTLPEYNLNPVLTPDQAKLPKRIKKYTCRKIRNLFNRWFPSYVSKTNYPNSNNIQFKIASNV